ncbi:transposable element Tcb2 transposase [Trichonephila clavipes]|uniref:Transposable element Tcb2 transposase n=1 Tax=Trichonephila clavipes TaxID=2585209 RepID=A0A8X6W3A3_TRICX|nr:transposable element Tcb2 transposase [Trichonephila clavipes]
MGAEFLFMDDNARPPRANIVDECLQSEDITLMDWLAYSPDLNPIEHNGVTETVGGRIYKMHVSGTGLCWIVNKGGGSIGDTVDGGARGRFSTEMELFSKKGRLGVNWFGCYQTGMVLQ